MKLQKVLIRVGLSVLIAMATPGLPKKALAQAPTNEDLQRYASAFAGKPCPQCYAMFLILMQRGWGHLAAFHAVWAYSNGWITGYPDGCYVGYWNDYRTKAPNPPPEVVAQNAQMLAYYLGVYQQNLQLNQSYTPEVWGMYQVGYLDARVQAQREFPGCQGNQIRDLTLADYLAYFRGLGVDPCDPAADLPINPAGWGPFGGSILGRC
jgi:hypothetical protein